MMSLAQAHSQNYPSQLPRRRPTPPVGLLAGIRFAAVPDQANPFAHALQTKRQADEMLTYLFQNTPSLSEAMEQEFLRR